MLKDKIAFIHTKPQIVIADAYPKGSSSVTYRRVSRENAVIARFVARIPAQLTYRHLAFGIERFKEQGGERFGNECMIFWIDDFKTAEVFLQWAMNIQCHSGVDHLSLTLSQLFDLGRDGLRAVSSRRVVTKIHFFEVVVLLGVVFFRCKIGDLKAEQVLSSRRSYLE